MSDSVFAYASPLLDLDGAVPPLDGSPDPGVPWHYGDPFGEQRAATTSAAVVDRSHRAVLTVDGPERLTWLHTISSQHIAALPDGSYAENLSLDLQGRVEDHFVVTELDGRVWIDTERQRGGPLLDFLTKMVFWSQAEPKDAPEWAVLSLLGPRVDTDEVRAALGIDALPTPPTGVTPLPTVDGGTGGFVRAMNWPTEHAWDLVVPRSEVRGLVDRLRAAGVRPAGSWAFEALRVAAVRPRLALDTDDRTIPHEVRWIGGPPEGGAVHLDKGCYRGQETVARVHNLGQPPRTLVLVHLDGSSDTRPEPGDPITAGGRTVGRLGTVVDHADDGPIALALVKRTLPLDTELEVGGCAAKIDPDSVPDTTRVQAGRAAIDRLRGR